MGVFYRVYVNRWLTGELRVVHIPTANIVGTGTTQYFDSIPEAETALSYFDHTYTYIYAEEASYNVSRDWGFLETFAIKLWMYDNHTVRLYFEENTYIEIRTNASYGITVEYCKNGVRLATIQRGRLITPLESTNGDGCYMITYTQPPNVTMGVYAYSSSSSSNNMSSLLAGIDPYTFPTDPYEDGGIASTGGGGGAFDSTGDPIDIPNLPTLSAANTGFIALFNPSPTQLYNLADYMWNNNLFDIDTWKKIFADPMDAILGLSIVPVAIPQGSPDYVTVGNISTGVSMTKASTQYVKRSCGSVSIEEYWGSYLDYDPYTRIQIYLPYIGFHQLSADDVMNKTVQVEYNIDILSGACCAFIKAGDSVLYSFSGACAAQIPVSGSNWTELCKTIVSAVVGAAEAGISIYGAAKVAAGSSAKNAMNTFNAKVANTIAGNVGSFASDVMSSKPAISHSGGIGSTCGLLAIQTPYLIITRPRQALPERQNEYTGYPSFITSKISELQGYTEIAEMHLEGMSCTSEEEHEIEAILKGGAIL